MRKAISTLIIFVVGSTLFLSAQEDPFENFTWLKSSGNIPESFITLTCSKVEADISNIDQSQRRKLRKQNERFLINSNYAVDQLLISGRVLFNDPVGNYVNKVAKVIIDKVPDLKGNDIEFYVVKSEYVNAFAFDNGSIFINIGLIAQLENEAQLAFILCHELVHYVEKHNLNTYIEYQSIENSDRIFNKTSVEEKLLAKSNYSKELESEADLKGLDYYMKTPYSSKAIDGVFDVLKYSYLPFDEVKFEKAFLEDKNLVIPKNYLLDKVNAIVADENYNDSFSTHPNTLKRRTDVGIKLKTFNRQQEGEEFIVSKDDFLKARELARFELCRLYLQKRKYAEAIYASYLLSKDHPNNAYLEGIISKALFNASVYKNEDEFDEVVQPSKDIQGESQQVNYLLEKLNSRDLGILALEYAWNYKKNHPSSSFNERAIDTLMKYLVLDHKLDFSYFKNPKDTLQVENINNQDSIDSEDLSKYDKIKQEQSDEELSFTHYAFADFLDDPDFRKRFKEYIKYYSERTVTRRKRKLRRQESRLRKERLKEQRKEMLFGKALGIRKVVIINPFYRKIDQRKKEAVRYQNSEKKQIEFAETIEDNAKLAGIKFEMLDPNSYSKSETEKFNDYALISEWLIEDFNHGDDVESRVLSNYDLINALSEKYDTRYLLWPGFIKVREKQPVSVGDVLGVLMIYGIPFVLLSHLTPSYTSLYYSVLFDTETGSVVLFDRNLIYKKDRHDIVNSFVYHTFHQINSKR